MESTKVETVYSGVYFEKRLFAWNIENFDIIQQNGDLVSSQKFYFNAGVNMDLPTEWKIYLLPTTYKMKSCDEERRSIGIYLQLEKKPVDVAKVIAAFSAKIRRKDGTHFYYNETGFKTFEQNGNANSWGWSKALSQNALLQNLPLFEGSLLVELEFILCVPQWAEIHQDVINSEVLHREKFNVKSDTDLATSEKETLESVDTVDGVIPASLEAPEVIPASKQICKPKRRSLEKHKRPSIRLSHLSSKDVLSFLLHFIYTGKFYKEGDNAEVITELRRAAENEKLSDLLEFMDKKYWHGDNKPIISADNRSNVSEEDIIRFTSVLDDLICNTSGARTT